MQARGVEGQTRAFEDTDALGALDAIADDRPDVVLIERGFAESSRGAALIKRIKADPALTACNIRVVGPDGRDAGRDDPSSTSLGRAASGSPVVADTAPSGVAKLDQRGTRRAPRAVMPEGVTVQLDGNPTTLVNLSYFGAQIICADEPKTRPTHQARAS